MHCLHADQLAGYPFYEFVYLCLMHLLLQRTRHLVAELRRVSLKLQVYTGQPNWVRISTNVRVFSHTRRCNIWGTAGKSRSDFVGGLSDCRFEKDF